MPLPPTLASRLSKRGLLNVNTLKSNEKEKKKDYKGVSGCPNKSNVYHECTHWCEMHWKGVTTPDPKYLRNVAKLTQKYPLPQNWMEVFDKGLGRYYYWDLETDLVSWLPPKHPKARPTESAAKLREKLHSGRSTEERIVYKNDNERDQEKKREKRDKDRSDRKDREREKDRERTERDKESDRDRKDKHEDKEKRKRVRKEDNLDPMDPAAYSDCPVGTWSDGLETNKSGADSTASGALYQQRPYPAPGEVLANNKLKKRRD